MYCSDSCVHVLHTSEVWIWRILPRIPAGNRGKFRQAIWNMSALRVDVYRLTSLKMILERCLSLPACCWHFANLRSHSKWTCGKQRGSMYMDTVSILTSTSWPLVTAEWFLGSESDLADCKSPCYMDYLISAVTWLWLASPSLKLTWAAVKLLRLLLKTIIRKKF